MKAITILQPFAQLIVMNEKHLETRKWETSYRGPLLIHAGKSRCNFEFKNLPLKNSELGTSLQQDALRPTLIRGAILGIVDLVACLTHDDLQGPHSYYLTPLEKLVGFIGPGWCAWELKNPRTFRKPIPCTGNMGIWDTPASLDQVLEEAIHESLPALREEPPRIAA